MRSVLKHRTHSLLHQLGCGGKRVHEGGPRGGAHGLLVPELPASSACPSGPASSSPHHASPRGQLWLPGAQTAPGRGWGASGSRGGRHHCAGRAPKRPCGGVLLSWAPSESRAGSESLGLWGLPAGTLLLPLSAGLAPPCPDTLIHCRQALGCSLSLPVPGSEPRWNVGGLWVWAPHPARAAHSSWGGRVGA